MSLTLRNQVRIVIIAVILLWFLSHELFVGVRNFLEGWEFWTLLLAIVIGIGVANLLARRTVSLYRTAVAREDLPVAKRQYQMMQNFWKRRGSETIKTYGINLLILEGNYREAIEKLQKLDTKRIGKKWAPVVTTQIAWCLAQLGEPAKALELVHPLEHQLETMGPDSGCYGHLVLGVAHFLLGDSNEAVRHLEKANSTTSPSRKSTVLFYLGESYTALGNAGGARLAYQHAHEALPTGRFGITAMERSKQL
jgi:tetratricopeptide (TPR) repeat protein